MDAPNVPKGPTRPCHEEERRLPGRTDASQGERRTKNNTRLKEVHARGRGRPSMPKDGLRRTEGWMRLTTEDMRSGRRTRPRTGGRLHSLPRMNSSDRPGSRAAARFVRTRCPDGPRGSAILSDEWAARLVDPSAFVGWMSHGCTRPRTTVYNTPPSTRDNNSRQRTDASEMRTSPWTDALHGDIK